MKFFIIKIKIQLENLKTIQNLSNFSLNFNVVIYFLNIIIYSVIKF